MEEVTANKSYSDPRIQNCPSRASVVNTAFPNKKEKQKKGQENEKKKPTTHDIAPWYGI